MSSRQIVIAYDAYGTLLSTESIAKKLAGHFGQDKATTIAATWRKYQLEYTWRFNSQGNTIMSSISQFQNAETAVIKINTEISHTSHCNPSNTLSQSLAYLWTKPA